MSAAEQESIIIGNFDVLVEEVPGMAGGNFPKIRLIASKASHVGNNRFQVLLRMNSPQYNSALIASENTQTVVERVADIVCRQVVPNGRFLVQKSQNKWEALSRDRVLEFIREKLDDHVDSSLRSKLMAESPPRRRSSEASSQKMSPLDLPHRASSSNEGDVPAAPSSPLTEEDNDALLRALGPMFFDGPGDSMDDKKRRRRSSLLRRSVSESTLMTNNNTGEIGFDKKKALRKQSHLEQGMASAASFVASLDFEQAALELEPTAIDESAVRAQHSGGGQKKPLPRLSFLFRPGGQSGPFDDNLVNARSNIVTTAEALDVIFQPMGRRGGVMGVQSHTGNNRLKVLMELQAGKFKSSFPAQQREIVLDMQNTVQKHWGGRFLLESDDSGYALLSDEEATGMLLTAYDEHVGKSSNERPTQQQPQEDILTEMRPKSQSLNLNATGIPNFLQHAAQYPHAGSHHHETLTEIRPKSQSLNLSSAGVPELLQSTLPGNPSSQQQDILTAMRPKSQSLNMNSSSIPDFLQNAVRPKSQSVNGTLLQHFQPSAVDTATINQMRNQALQSLQKRKKRQGVSSKMQNLAALTRSTSEPVQYMNGAAAPGSNAQVGVQQQMMQQQQHIIQQQQLNQQYQMGQQQGYPPPAQPFQPRPPTVLPYGAFASSFSSADSVLIGRPQPMVRSESAPIGVTTNNAYPQNTSKVPLPQLSAGQINQLVSGMDMSTRSAGSMVLQGQNTAGQQSQQQEGQGNKTR